MTRTSVTALSLSLVLAIGLPLAAHAGPPDEHDGDGIPDVLDKCTMDSRNGTAPATCDTDCDGYGNVCDADFDQSYSVTAADFAMFFIPAFKATSPNPNTDMDCSGSTLANDFSMYFVPRFKGSLGGAMPGPSGLACAGQPGCGC